jgi:ABC-type nitrate/sulfonate/bicarbonate transport system substrate-binding protein
VATSEELAPLHPGKVLVVRREFVRDRAGEHERLIAALLEACAFCDQPGNRPLLARMLAAPHYVNAPADCLERGLAAPADAADDPAAGLSARNIFSRYNANEPTEEKADWLIGRLQEFMGETIQKVPPLNRMPALRNVFRREIFERARTVLQAQARTLNAEAADYTAARRTA